MPISLLIRLWVDALLLYAIVGLLLYTAVTWQTRSLKTMPLPERIRYIELAENDLKDLPGLTARRTRAARLLGLLLISAAIVALLPIWLISLKTLPDDLMWLIVPLLIVALGIPGFFWPIQRYQHPIIIHDQQLYQSLALTTQRLIAWRRHFFQYLIIGWLSFAELAIAFWLTIFIKTYLHWH